MIKDEAIEKALRTWYSVRDPLHKRAHHPLGKLAGEWGELLDDYMKSIYKPDCEPDFLDELGDIWYYLRVLCYQRDYQPNAFNPPNLETDELIAMALQEAANAFLAYKRFGNYSLFCLDVSYTILGILAYRYATTLDKLTELNWQ